MRCSVPNVSKNNLSPNTSIRHVDQAASAQEPANGPLPGDPVADAALDWFVTLHSGTATATERAAFAVWYRAAPSHAAAFERIAEVAALPELGDANRHAHAGARPPTRRRPFLPWAAAAAAVFVVVIGLRVAPQIIPLVAADIRTAAGERRLVTLPDGSSVLLDAGSAITLEYSDRQRGVTLLAGAAFFEVRPDAARPFQVTGGFSTTRVTGTGFSVTRDRTGDQVLLAHGRVTVTGQGAAGHARHLTPGEGVRIDAAGLGPLERPDPALAFAWRDGRYSFRDQPLTQVVEGFRRYHPAPILVIGDRLAAVTVSGTYRTDDPEGALRSLAAIAGGRLERLPGGLLLLH